MNIKTEMCSFYKTEGSLHVAKTMGYLGDNKGHIKGDEANLSLFLFHKNRNISIKICSNLKSNTIFELLIEICVSWNTKKLHLSKYEGNDKQNTKK